MNSTNTYQYYFLTSCLLITFLFSAQGLSAYECLVTTSGGTASATSNGTQSMACGTTASAAGFASTTIGRNSKALGDYSVALGSFSVGTLGYSTAIGSNAAANGISSTALGEGAQAASNYTTSIGRQSYASGISSTALGRGSEIYANTSIALGAFSRVSAGANYGIAIGSDASGDNIGAQVTATGAIALGNDVINDVANSMKIVVPLRIQGDTGEAGLLVEEASPTTAQRFTVEMKNNGGTGFLITNTSKPASQWQFSSQPNEAFTASFIGTGGPEMQVRKDGAVQFGPGNVVNFNLTANGHMTLLHGSATATTFITSSSRDVKKDFKKVNPEGILQKIKNLDITQWRYKNENEKGRHIGPMAEDFYKLFKLGADNKHVLGTDMASIAIVAAKELHEKASIANAETIQLKQETAKLKAENTKLKERMASLENLVTNLASADGSLKESGKKIALAK